jgi:hypothetical protein
MPAMYFIAALPLNTPIAAHFYAGKKRPDGRTAGGAMRGRRRSPPPIAAHTLYLQRYGVF